MYYFTSSFPSRREVIYGKLCKVSTVWGYAKSSQYLYRKKGTYKGEIHGKCINFTGVHLF